MNFLGLARIICKIHSVKWFKKTGKIIIAKQEVSYNGDYQTRIEQAGRSNAFREKLYEDILELSPKLLAILANIKNRVDVR